MQIPLVAVSTTAMRPTVTSVATAVLGGAALSAADAIGLCQMITYADGGLYCRVNADDICLGDLGDFPAKKSLPLLVNWADDGTLHLLKESSTRGVYIEYRDQLYLDATPGAFEPLRFTPDNTTLSGGETSWYWTGAAGFIMWTPTGDIMDSTPDRDGTLLGQGFQQVEVEGYPGLYRWYWNQTLFDEVVAGRAHGGWLGICHGDYEGEIVRGDRP